MPPLPPVPPPVVCTRIWRGLASSDLGIVNISKPLRWVDITSGARVHAIDGDIGRVDQVELDPVTGELDAFWIRADGIFGHEIRIPAEWIERADESGVYVKASKVDIETRLGPQSRALARKTT